MASSQDLAWATVTPRKCRRHLWVPDAESMAEPVLSPTGGLVGYSLPPEAAGKYHCARCRKPFSPEGSRRGRNNRKRGNSIELWVCKLLGIERVGQYGRIEDGGNDSDFLRVQVKSGGAHQAALLAKIHTIPANADQLRGWVTVSTPGAGHPREGVISFDLREFSQWYGHGKPEDEAA